MGFMDDAKRAAEDVAHKAKEAWEDVTDRHDDKAGEHKHDHAHHDHHHDAASGTDAAGTASSTGSTAGAAGAGTTPGTGRSGAARPGVASAGTSDPASPVAPDERRAQATSGNPAHEHEMEEQLRRDP